MTSSSEIRIGKKYLINRKIGSGSFGDIYLGTDTTTGVEIAIKLEQQNVPHPQLIREAKIYRSLSGVVGIPVVHWYGSEPEHTCNAMVIDLLSKSLEDYFEDCGRRFNLKTVLMIADQLICRIEILHIRCYIHRDIKPDNFLMGRGPTKNLLYMIDLGLSKLYRDPRTNKHIPYKEGKNLTGTARYASINTHMGVEQSRRDDMESIGYMLIYFLKGSLPWQGIKSPDKKQKYELIYQKKNTTTIDMLCEGLPAEFKAYMQHVRKLGFDDRPDYDYLRHLFKDIFERKKYIYDCNYDWYKLQAPGSGPGSPIGAGQTATTPAFSTSTPVNQNTGTASVIAPPPTATTVMNQGYSQQNTPQATVPSLTPNTNTNTNVAAAAVNTTTTTTNNNNNNNSNFASLGQTWPLPTNTNSGVNNTMGIQNNFNNTFTASNNFQSMNSTNLNSNTKQAESSYNYSVMNTVGGGQTIQEEGEQEEEEEGEGEEYDED